jgi:hypothetical protein
MLGGGYFVGVLFTLILTYILYFVGVPISRYHALFFLIGSLIWSLFFFKGKIGLVLIFGSHILFYFFLILVGLFTSRIYSTNWDGVKFSKEVVIGLSCEWNPVNDKDFDMRSELSEKYPALREGNCVSYGHKILAGTILWSIVTRLLDDYESGKAINLMYAIAGFLLLFGLLQKMGFPVGWSSGLSLLCILNPVVSSQLLSFTYDGQIAVFCAILALLTLRFFQTFSTIDICLFAVVALLTVASKISGIGIVALFGFVIFVRLAVHLFRKSETSRIYLLFSSILILILALIGPDKVLEPFFGSRADSYSYSSLSNSYSLEKRFGRNVLRNHPEIANMNGLKQFFRSRFADTRFSVGKPKYSSILTIEEQGLKVYRNAISSPFTGGFGPVFSLCFLLGTLALLLASVMRRGTILAYYSVMLAILVSLYFSPSFLPRWSHQGWLLPVFGLMALVDRRRMMKDETFADDDLNPIFSLAKDNRLYRLFTILVLWVILLNGFSVLVLQVGGYLKDRDIIEAQLDLVSKLEQPVSVEFSRYQSTRTWFISHGIDYRVVEDVVPPYIALHKTDTRIAVRDSVFDEIIPDHEIPETFLSVLDRLDRKVDLSPDLHLNDPLYER